MEVSAHLEGGGTLWSRMVIVQSLGTWQMVPKSLGCMSEHMAPATEST